MKILFISGTLCDGGAQRVIAVVSSKLAEDGHDVSLLLYSRNEKEYAISQKVKVFALAERFENYSKISSLKRILLIRNIIRKVSPDVSVGFLEGGYGLFLASWGMKIKKVASARIDPNILFKKKGMRATIDRMWFRHADAVVVQTEGQKDHVKNAKWKNVTVIANPIPKESLIGYRHNYDHECTRILMVGRLAEQKNYVMAIEAMEKVHKKYPNVTLDIFGKGDQLSLIQSLIVNKGLEDTVMVKGWTQNVLEEYEKHDMFLLTSDFEGMPNALMEAMAAGLPCVSTDCETGPSDLIFRTNENGILIPVGNSEKLAQQICSICKMDFEERAKIGNSAYKSIEKRYNSEKISKQWLELFSRLK